MQKRAQLSMNPRPNITSYHVCMEDRGAKGQNLDVGRGPPNITSSGSFKTVGLGILIKERLKLTLVFTRGQL